MPNNDDLCPQCGAYWKCECPPLGFERASDGVFVKRQRLFEEITYVSEPMFSRDAIVVIRDEARTNRGYSHSDPIWGQKTIDRALPEFLDIARRVRDGERT